MTDPRCPDCGGEMDPIDEDAMVLAWYCKRCDGPQDDRHLVFNREPYRDEEEWPDG